MYCHRHQIPADKDQPPHRVPLIRPDLLHQWHFHLAGIYPSLQWSKDLMKARQCKQDKEEDVPLAQRLSASRKSLQKAVSKAPAKSAAVPAKPARVVAAGKAPVSGEAAVIAARPASSKSTKQSPAAQMPAHNSAKSALRAPHVVAGSIVSAVKEHQAEAAPEAVEGSEAVQDAPVSTQELGQPVLQSLPDLSKSVVAAQPSASRKQQSDGVQAAPASASAKAVRCMHTWSCSIHWAHLGWGVLSSFHSNALKTAGSSAMP